MARQRKLLPVPVSVAAAVAAIAVAGHLLPERPAQILVAGTVSSSVGTGCPADGSVVRLLEGRKTLAKTHLDVQQGVSCRGSFSLRGVELPDSLLIEIEGYETQTVALSRVRGSLRLISVTVNPTGPEAQVTR